MMVILWRKSCRPMFFTLTPSMTMSPFASSSILKQTESQRRLACTSASNDSNLLTGLDVKAQVVQHVFELRTVLELIVAQHNFA